ncbi:enoyl-CoA hydratase/isomerase family protein [Collimonas arenae]|uniref:Enoyl-CoA hydratase/isomerase family protein n=2 Tax=Collimonas arenae TaxID=279058 RepID=A0A127QDT9_9BURK|nr:enoyl-CoA hydratase/isomerase family protein [Collimonas arenae]AMP08210.1 enoyl-CoA hydratase/isomerase family protein [Collimonas arenae]
MAISADFIVMRDDGQIGLPEVSIRTHAGGTSILPRLVGLGKARELIFLGSRINGVEAKRIGLAHDSSPDEAF